MLYHLREQKRLCAASMASSRKEYTAVYKVDNIAIYKALDLICKDACLYCYLKQFMSEQDCRGAFYAIYAWWLGLNHVNMSASEAEASLQTMTYDGKKKTQN